MTAGETKGDYFSVERSCCSSSPVNIEMLGGCSRYNIVAHVFMISAVRYARNILIQNRRATRHTQYARSVPECFYTGNVRDQLSPANKINKD